MKKQSQSGDEIMNEWEGLGAKDKKILASVLTTGSPERSLRVLGISNGSFYRHWKKIKPLYEQTMAQLPEMAKQMLVSSSLEAAQVLISGLKSNSESIRQNAAKQILSHVITNKPTDRELKQKISIEEWVAGWNK